MRWRNQEIKERGVEVRERQGKRNRNGMERGAVGERSWQREKDGARVAWYCLRSDYGGATHVSSGQLR